MTDIKISDTTLRGQSFERVRRLSGFMRFHHEPEEHTPKAERFVQVAGSADLAQRAESLFRAIRKGLGYKRKEVTLACDEGGASIGTPDFDVALSLHQDPDDAGRCYFLTEVSGFRRRDLITSREFLTLFSPCCDTVAIQFARPVDLEEIIDRLEENDDLAGVLDYDSVCSWFTLRLPQLLVEVKPTQMTCKLAGETNLEQLILQTETALSRLAGTGLARNTLAG